MTLYNRLRVAYCAVWLRALWVRVTKLAMTTLPQDRLRVAVW